MAKQLTPKCYIQKKVKSRTKVFSSPSPFSRAKILNKKKKKNTKGHQSKYTLTHHFTITGKGNWPPVMRDGGSPLHLWPVSACYTQGSVSHKQNHTASSTGGENNPP